MFQEKKLEKIEKSASKKISRTDIIKNEENQVVVRQIFDKADKEDINNQRQFEKSRLSEHKQVAESKFKDFTALKEKANKQPINN